MTEPPITLLPAEERAALEAATAPAEITVSCPDCGETFTGPPSGKLNAKWKLGTHRYNRHGTRAESDRRRPKSSKRAPASVLLGDDRPALAAVADIRSAAGGDRRTSAAPTDNDLAGGIGRALQLLTVAGASFVVETDRSIPDGEDGNQIREQLIDYLSLDEQGARAAMAPVGRLLAPTKFNQKHGRKIVENADVVGSISDVALLFMHWRTVMRARTAPGGLMALATGVVVIQQPQFVAPQMPAYDATAAVPPPQDLATPSPQGGHVVSAEDVAHMRANGGS